MLLRSSNKVGDVHQNEADGGDVALFFHLSVDTDNDMVERNGSPRWLYIRLEVTDVDKVVLRVFAGNLSQIWPHSIACVYCDFSQHSVHQLKSLELVIF